MQKEPFFLGILMNKWHPSVQKVVRTWIKQHNYKSPWARRGVENEDQKRAVVFWTVKALYIVRLNKHKGL